jgi:hypothetical protein
MGAETHAFSLGQGNPRNWLRGYASTAGGILSLQLLGLPNAAEALAGGETLFFTLRNDPQARKHPYDFYGTWFMAQSMALLGGNYAAQARVFLEANLPNSQAKDGSWIGVGPEQPQGRVYATSLAMLSLTAKERHSPLLRP